VARKDKTDVPFGGPEPKQPGDKAQTQESKRSLAGWVKNQLTERETRKVCTLKDGRICTQTTYDLVQSGHQYLGSEGWIEIREGAPGTILQRWRRWQRKIDPPIATIPGTDLRIIAREYTIKRKRADAGPNDFDEVWMIQGGHARMIGHKPAASLLGRLRRFEREQEGGEAEQATPVGLVADK